MKEVNRPPLVLRIPTFTQGLMVLLEYAWAVVVVLNGNSVFHAYSIKSYHLLELSLVFTYLLLAMELYVYRLRPAWDQLLLAVGLMIYSVVYIAARQSSMSVINFVFLFVIGLPGLFLLFSIRHSRGRLLPLIRRLYDVIVILAVISLYYWTFGVMLKIIPANCYTVIDWGYRKYVLGYDWLHFSTQLDTTFFPDAFIYRNSSIFTEAPMFNLWLDMALAGELFLKDRTSKLRVVVLTIAILTTLTVTGLLFLGICGSIHIVRNYHNMDRKQKGAVLTAGMVLLPMLAVVAIYTLVLKSDTQSYSMRLSDYVAGIKLWWDYPLFGAGYANLQALLPYMYSPDGLLGFSNSLTAVLGTGGLWIAAIFYIPHFGALLPRLTGDSRLSAFALCYLYLFCTTAFFGRYIVVVMAAFMMALMFESKKKAL